MTKQEFLAMSLPYGVKIIDLYWPSKLTGINGNEYHFGNNLTIEDAENVEPVLHPLSDLTKEIEYKGEKFNPSHKLGTEIRGGIEFYKPSNFDLEINIESPNYSTQIDLYDGFLIIQKLIEWHFDIADLISKGEAIDVNTLEINPYK